MTQFEIHPRERLEALEKNLRRIGERTVNGNACEFPETEFSRIYRIDKERINPRLITILRTACRLNYFDSESNTSATNFRLLFLRVV